MLDAIGPRRLHALAMLIAGVVLALAMAIPSVDVVIGLVAATALVLLGARTGGARSLDGVLLWLVLPHRAVLTLVHGDDYNSAYDERERRRADRSMEIATILAGGTSAASADGVLRQHRIGKVDAGSRAIGWWVTVPDGAAAVQMRVQASPVGAVALHVGVEGEWIAAAGPASPVLVHRMQLPPGQVYVQVSAVGDGSDDPVLELWIEPAPTSETVPMRPGDAAPAARAA